jgi:hypothetical protein
MLKPYARLSNTEVSKVGRDYAVSMEKRSAPIDSSTKYFWLRYEDENATPSITDATMIQEPRRGRGADQALRKCDNMHWMWMSLKDLDWTEE